MNDEEKFSFTKEIKDDRTIISLKGVINETTEPELAGIFQDIQTETVDIVLKDIARINSCGVRDWVKIMKPVNEKYQISYIGCSRAIVDQLNMIINFLSAGKILSFYAPYLCDECDKEHEMLIEIQKHFAKADDLDEPEAPDFECPACDKIMEFNEDEDKYFSFLTE